MKREDVLGRTGPQLAALLRGGHAIDPAWLDDVEYRGISLGLPPWVEALSWKTFKKVFHRDPESGRLRGWNVRMEQHGLDGPWRPRLRRGVPITFGHYEVVAATPGNVPPGCERGLLIDYGRGNPSVLDPTRHLRDPIVALEPGKSDMLLGWSFVQLGRHRVSTPSYFLLERDGPLTHRA